MPHSAKTLQSLEQGKKSRKKPADYQSLVARHLVENDAGARAYNGCSFSVLLVSLSKSRLDVIEALYIRSLKPDLCPPSPPRGI